MVAGILLAFLGLMIHEYKVDAINKLVFSPIFDASAISVQLSRYSLGWLFSCSFADAELALRRTFLVLCVLFAKENLLDLLGEATGDVNAVARQTHCYSQPHCPDNMAAFISLILLFPVPIFFCCYAVDLHAGAVSTSLRTLLARIGILRRFLEETKKGETPRRILEHGIFLLFTRIC